LTIRIDEDANGQIATSGSPSGLNEVDETRFELDKIRAVGLLLGERRYVAMEALKAAIDYYATTKPSELLDTNTGTKGAPAYVIQEPQLREFWQTWVDGIKRDIFDTASKLPALLLRDVIKMFEEGNAEPPGTSPR
jgi:hypothetical protein